MTSPFADPSPRLAPGEYLPTKPCFWAVEINGQVRSTWRKHATPFSAAKECFGCSSATMQAWVMPGNARDARKKYKVIAEQLRQPFAQD